MNFMLQNLSKFYHVKIITPTIMIRDRQGFEGNTCASDRVGAAVWLVGGGEEKTLMLFCMLYMLNNKKTPPSRTVKKWDVFYFHSDQPNVKRESRVLRRQ